MEARIQWALFSTHSGDFIILFAIICNEPNIFAFEKVTMKRYFLLALTICIALPLSAQEEEEGGFKKEKLFTGGNISLSFFNNTFLIGSSPVLGYKLGRFADAGIVMNLQYSSIRDYYVFNDRLRQYLYGGGAFVRLFPVNFLFGQAQYEYNFITQKYRSSVNPSQENNSTTISGNSALVGVGYVSGRDPYNNSFFYYMSVMWDISGNENSPYTDAYGRSIPVIRAGFTIPLFQGGRQRFGQ